MNTFTRTDLNTLATKKLAQLQAQYHRTMQQHAELRKITPCQPFESVHVVMKRHALNPS